MGSPADVNTELRTRVRQQEVVAELGQQALETDDIDQLMHDAAVAVAETLDNDYCKVLEVLPGGDEVFLRQGVGWHDGYVGEATVPTDLDSQAGYTLISEEPVIVDDLETETRFSGPDLLVDHDVVSGISVIIGSVEEPWGILGTHTTDHREFTGHDANFVKNVANVLASAIENNDVRSKLTETKNRLEAATAAGSIGTWTWDIQNDSVTVDEYLAETYGVDPDVVGAGVPMETFYEPIHDDDLEETREQLDRAVEETGELEVEYRVQDSAGETTWILARGAVEYDTADEPVRMHGAIADITERKEHQRRLERYKQYTDDILDAVDDVLYVVDASGALQRWNESVSTVTGYSNAEIESMSTLDFFGEDADLAADAIEEGFETGSVLVEATVQTKDGDAIPYELSAATLEDPDGNPVLAGIGRDITARKERERELATYETIVETVGDGIYVKDEDDYFTMVNDAYAEMTGYDREELVGAHTSLVVDEETIEAARKMQGEVVDSDAAEPTMEATIQRADGSTFPAEGSFATIQTDDGEANEVGVVRDIAERKEQRRKIEESERRYRTLVENFPNGSVGLFDEDLQYTAVGGQLLDKLELSAEDRIGRSIYDLHSDDLLADIEPYFQNALDGEADSFEVEYRGRHLYAHTLPVRNGDGEVFAGMLVVQNVTERREVQRELRESEAKFRMIAENLEGIVWMATADGEEWIYINPAFEDIWGRDREELYDEPLSFLEAVHPDDRDRFRESFTSLPDEDLDEEFRIVRPDGDVRWVHVRGTQVQDESGEMVRTVGVGEDVTERVEREHRLEELVAELETSNERLEQFAYAASHDLQEPLRMVSSYLRLIEDRYADDLDTDGEEFLEFAVDGADRMRNMIEGLLQYSRVDTQGAPFEAVDLDDVLADVREDLTVRIAESDTGITVDSLPRVAGDADQLRQLFQNLLDNAIEYSGDEPPAITISAEQAGDEWVLSVSDEGIGIDSDDTDRIFEVFQSLHATEVHSGTGIGLALCERIVERHGGEIWVESESGEGATFSFTLPVADEEQ